MHIKQLNCVGVMKAYFIFTMKFIGCCKFFSWGNNRKVNNTQTNKKKKMNNSTEN